MSSGAAEHAPVHAWLQCPAGASGDMLLGALLDAGAPLEPVQSALGALRIGDGGGPAGPGGEPIGLTAHRVTRHGLAATKVEVAPPDSGTARAWPDIHGILAGADLPEPVRDLAVAVFARLARAEAVAHATNPERVHLHEVGALDALADVVGTCAALHALGVIEVACSPIALGAGPTLGGHGPLPVPGPAVLELFREVGAPVYTTELPYELCTPTGAALLASTVTTWGGMPPMRIHATGAGAGSRDPAELVNVARVVLGQRVASPVEAPEAVPGEHDPSGAGMLVLEANVDDLDPRLWSVVLDRLLEAGAVDAWATPILMKKGRPAHTLSVLVDPERADRVRRAVFAETPTLGLRERRVDRSVLDRTTTTVRVGGHTIRVKAAYRHGSLVGIQPEYADVATTAETLERPVREVLADATAAARAAHGL